MPGSLTIERFHIAGLAPAGHEAPDRLKARLAKLDARRLAARIAASLGEFGADDRRVLILRRLDLSLAGSRIDDVDRLARQLAEGVAAAVARLSGLAPSDRVAIFPSPGHHLAAFLHALVRGDAWGRWWFPDVDGLRLLPVSSAIRVALLRDPQTGLEALAALAPADRLPVASSLCAIDADLVLEGLAPALADAEEEEGEAWVEVFSLPPAAADLPLPAAILHDLAALAAGSPRPPPRAVLAALRLRAALRRAVPGGDPAGFIRTAAARGLASLARGVGARDVAALVALPASVRGRIADAVEQESDHAPACCAFTPFGGLLLLWPHLPIVDEDALPDGPGERSGLLALIALSALLGPQASGAALADPVLRSALRVEARADPHELAGWLGTVRPSALPAATGSQRGGGLPPPFRRHRRQARAVTGLGLVALRDLARRLPGFAAASLPFLRANLLGVGARVLVSDTTIHAVIDHPPLDVLLSISGLADRTIDLADGRRLHLERSP